MTWSPQQDAAIKDVKQWLKDPSRQVFRLFGFAGTGKTTLAKTLAGDVRGKVLYGAFTGKAALQLQKKGCSGASTIHSMIYSVNEEGEDWEPKFVLNPASEVATAKLVVIDEVSMVGEELARDLLSFGAKVLVLGDPAQLPPVKDAGYFIDAKPDVMLTEIHRQAAENPIIWMSMKVRQGERLEIGQYGSSEVRSRREATPGDILAADQVLVGLNRTRKSYNDRIRQLKGFDSPLPQLGDKLVCLRNDKEKKLLNGGLWTVTDVLRVTPQFVTLLVMSEDHVETKPTEVRVRKEFFTGGEELIPYDELRGSQQFTYGYALTVHKSQGSQWDNVVVFDESHAFREARDKHRYTAITRAAESVKIFV